MPVETDRIAGLESSVAVKRYGYLQCRIVARWEDLPGPFYAGFFFLEFQV